MKPNQPIPSQSGKCAPHKETVQEFLDRRTAELTGPRKPTHKLSVSEIEEGPRKRVAKVEIPETPEELMYSEAARAFDENPNDTTATAMFATYDAWEKTSYHCKRCDKDVVDNRCECLSSPSPWELKGLTPRMPDGVWTEDYYEKEPRSIWKWVAIVLFLLLAFVTVVLSYKINQLNEVIDFQQEIFEELERVELPQGNGEIQTPPPGWIDPNTIIRLDRKITLDPITTAGIEATHEF